MTDLQTARPLGSRHGGSSSSMSRLVKPHRSTDVATSARQDATEEADGRVDGVGGQEDQEGQDRIGRVGVGGKVGVICMGKEMAGTRAMYGRIESGAHRHKEHAYRRLGFMVWSVSWGD